jgi:hypothetical protein
VRAGPARRWCPDAGCAGYPLTPGPSPTGRGGPGRRFPTATVCLWLVLALVLFGGRARGDEPAPESSITLLGAPAGAEVFIDEKLIGTTPLPGRVPIGAGVHQVRIARPGYAPYSDSFRVRDGLNMQLLIEMVPIAGVLRLRSKVERARVLVDGAFVGETPLEVELTMGPHQVRVARPGYRDEVFDMISVAGEIVEREVRLAEVEARRVRPPAAERATRWYGQWWVWTLVTLGAGAVAAAIVVPTVYASRKPCQRLDVDLCIPVEPAAGGLLLRF